MISILEFEDDLDLLDDIRLAYRKEENANMNLAYFFLIRINAPVSEQKRKYILEFLWQEEYLVNNHQMEYTVVKQKLLNLDSFKAEYQRALDKVETENNDKQRERNLKKSQLRSSKIALPVSILALIVSGISAFHNVTKKSYDDKQNEMFQKLQGFWIRKTDGYGLYVTGKTLTITTDRDSLIIMTQEYPFMLEDSVLRIKDDSLVLTAEIRKLDEKELSLVVFQGKSRGQWSENVLNLDGEYSKGQKFLKLHN